MEPFQPIESKKVKMYTCGPSTYQRPHIGNYRTFLFEDILQRYLECLGYRVLRLMTLTDVEDKAIRQAQKEGVTVEEVTARNEKVFLQDLEKLRIKRPDLAVRASSIADQATRLMGILLDKGVAYKYMHEGKENIYYDPLKFKGFGKLAHLEMKKWPKAKRRFHLDTYPGTPWNRGDFILWHGCRQDEVVCWETEIGRGRPSWNIQDAAIVTKHLGFQVDIACGGVDNLVRHHDYVLAISEAVSGKQFSRYWLHGGHLFVDGKKMSKSTGNVLYPEDLTTKGYELAHIRFFLIYGAYEEKRNFTWQKLAEAKHLLDDFRREVKEIEAVRSTSSSKRTKALIESLRSGFEHHMDDDLDVKRAFDSVRLKVSLLHRFAQEGKLSVSDAENLVSDLKRVDCVLQVIF